MTVASLWKALDQAECGQPVGEEDMIDPQRRTAKVNPWTFNDQQRRDQRIEDRPSLAVDLSIWICESLTSTAMNDFNENPALHLVFTRTMKLLRMGIKLVVVVEGKRRIRAKNSNDKPDKFRRRRSGTSFWRACTQCEQMLKFLGVPVVRAKAEGEALCALLNQQGIVDGVISNDGDCLLFGAKVVYTKFSIDNLDKGCVMRYDASSLYAIAEGTTEEATGGAAVTADKDKGANDKTSDKISLSREDLVAFALLTGSDLAGDGIDKVGHKKATRFIRKCKLDRPLSLASAAMDELRSWARSVKPIDDTVEDNHGEEDALTDNDMGEENDKGKTETKKKASCCSRCSHAGSKRSHEKHGCEVCGTGPGEPCYKLSTEDKFRKSLRAKAIALRDPKFDPTLVVNAYMRPNDNQLPASLLSKGMSSRKTLRMDYPRLKDFVSWRTIVKGHCLKASQDFIKQSVSRLLVRTELFQNPSSEADKDQGLGGAASRRCARELPIPKEIMRKLVQNGIECYEVCWVMQATVTDKDGEGIDGYEFSSIEPQAMVNRQHPDIVSAFQKNPPKAAKEQGDAEMQKRREFLETLFQPADEKLATKQPADWDKDKRVFKQPVAANGKVPYAKAPPKEPKKKHCKTGGTDVALLMHSLKMPPAKSKTTDNVEDFDFSSIESGSIASKECADDNVKAQDKPVSALKAPPEVVGPTQRKDLPPKQKATQAGVSSDFADDKLSVLVLLPPSAVKNRKPKDGHRDVPMHVSVPTPPQDKKPLPPANPQQQHQHQHHQHRHQHHSHHQMGGHQVSRRRKASTPNKRQTSQPKRSRQKSPRAVPDGKEHGHIGRRSEGFRYGNCPEVDDVENNHHHYLDGGRTLLFHEASVLKDEVAFEGGGKLRFEHASSEEVAFVEQKTKSTAPRSPRNCFRSCGARALPDTDRDPRGGVAQLDDMSELTEYNDYNINSNTDQSRWCGGRHDDERRNRTPAVEAKKKSRYITESRGHHLDDRRPGRHHDGVEDPSLHFVLENYSEDFDCHLPRSKERGSQHRTKPSDMGRDLDKEEHLDVPRGLKRSTARRRHSDVEVSAAQEYFKDNLQDDCFHEGMNYDGDCDEPIHRGDPKRSSSRRLEVSFGIRYPNNESEDQSDGRDHQPLSRRAMSRPVRTQRIGPSCRARHTHKSRGERSPPSRKNRDGPSAEGRAFLDRGYLRVNNPNRTRRRSSRKNRHGSSSHVRHSMDPSYPRAQAKRKGERDIHRNIGVTAAAPQPKELFYDGAVLEPTSWTQQLAAENYDEQFSDDHRFHSDGQYSYDCDCRSDDELSDDPEEQGFVHYDEQVRHHCDQQMRDDRDHFHDVQLPLYPESEHRGRGAASQQESDYATNSSFDEMETSELANYNLDVTHDKIAGADIMPEVRYQTELSDGRDCVGRDLDERMLLLDPDTDIGAQFGRKRGNHQRARSTKERLPLGASPGSEHQRYDKGTRGPCRRRRNGSPRHGKSSAGRHRHRHQSRASLEREIYDERMGRDRHVRIQKNIHEQLKRQVRHSNIHDDISSAGSTLSVGDLNHEHFMDDENVDHQHCYDDIPIEENMRYEEMP